MPELQTMETPKTAGFVNPKHNNRNRKRIEEDEKEIQELEGKTQEEEEVLKKNQRLRTRTLVVKRSLLKNVMVMYGVTCNKKKKTGKKSLLH